MALGRGGWFARGEQPAQCSSISTACRSTRLFAVVIANEMSSEVVVMSRLMANAPGIDATVAVHRRGDTARRVAALSGARVHEIDFGWSPPISAAPLARTKRVARQLIVFCVGLPGLVRLARQSRPDVIYSSQQKWDCLAAHLLAIVLRRPQVIHLHYVPGPWLGWHAQRRLARCAQVIGVSEFIRGRTVAAGTRPERAFAVLNPMPVNRESSVAAGTPEPAVGNSEKPSDVGEVRIGFVGRMSPDKGQVESVEAFARLQPSVRRRCRLVFVGGGDHSGVVQATARDLGVEDRIDFLGRRTDVAALLAQFDIFLHPSFEDPCPLAVLEAQAAGLPVVAFDEGGIREIVENGVTGLLVGDRNVVELAKALESLIGDAPAREAMGAAGKVRMADRFEPSEASRTFERVIGALVPGPLVSSTQEPHSDCA